MDYPPWHHRGYGPAATTIAAPGGPPAQQQNPSGPQAMHLRGRLRLGWRDAQRAAGQPANPLVGSQEGRAQGTHWRHVVGCWSGLTQAFPWGEHTEAFQWHYSHATMSLSEWARAAEPMVWRICPRASVAYMHTAFDWVWACGVCTCVRPACVLALVQKGTAAVVGSLTQQTRMRGTECNGPHLCSGLRPLIIVQQGGRCCCCAPGLPHQR